MAASGIRRRDEWGAFSVLSSIVAIRSGVYFGLQAFVPLWFVTQLGTGEGTGNAALTAMLVAGAFGTLIGGQLVDTVGPRKVLVGSILASMPLLVVFPLVGPATGFAVLTAIGLVIIASFSVTVVLGQQYLPNRPGPGLGRHARPGHRHGRPGGHDPGRGGRRPRPRDRAVDHRLPARARGAAVVPAAA